MNIVTNKKIHTEFWKRVKELDLSLTEIVEDATERGLKGLSKSRLSKYHSAFEKNDFKQIISPKILSWLMIRYGIFPNFNLGEPFINNGKIEYKIMPYDPVKCLRKLKQVFPDASNPTIKDFSDGQG